ncbi:hypothetical protein [Acetobacter oeni]|uniref:Uncharacterized protein n=1 Tax=Acetobacter oeni TaxID=304077 RepID=A0A511XP54_9PROT|nr:hypothetical protein [Acetobacter oeni]MBB3884505.1 hypothetical protein [Acetobacter oeni]NHO20437.1 hypothetical protein [Acetobacter oeni]GBR00583.1 hypothetical protein AA21952_0151 [Acetobacter oeni LMG 21952]GEN64684.1 hypothetical protein AOE01nite_29080 [Acetobacter oeni]
MRRFAAIMLASAALFSGTAFADSTYEVSGLPAGMPFQTGDAVPFSRTVNGTATPYQFDPSVAFANATDPKAWHQTSDLAAALVTPAGGTQVALGTELTAIVQQIAAAQATASAALTTTTGDVRYVKQLGDVSSNTVTSGGSTMTIEALAAEVAAGSGGGTVTGITQAEADARYWQLTSNIAGATYGTTTLSAQLATYLTSASANSAYWSQTANISAAFVTYSGGTTTLSAALAAAAASGSGGSSTTATVPVTTTTSPGASYPIAYAASGSVAYDVTPSQALALTLSGGTAGQEQRITVVIRQGATGYAVTLPAGVIWAGSTPAVSTTAGQATILTFYTDDGGATIFGKSGF